MKYWQTLDNTWDLKIETEDDVIYKVRTIYSNKLDQMIISGEIEQKLKS